MTRKPASRKADLVCHAECYGRVRVLAEQFALELWGLGLDVVEGGINSVLGHPAPDMAASARVVRECRKRGAFVGESLTIRSASATDYPDHREAFGGELADSRGAEDGARDCPGQKLHLLVSPELASPRPPLIR